MSLFKFISELGKEGGSADFFGDIDQNFTVTPGVFKCSRAKIRNSNFKKLSFKNLDVNEGIVFVSCKFESVNLEGVTSTRRESDFGEKSGGIYFINCVFADYLLIEDCTIARDVVIKDKCELNVITVKSLTTTEGGLIIKDSIITGSVDLSQNVIYTSLSLNTSQFTGKVELKGNNASSIAIGNNHFKNQVLLWGGELRTGLSVFGGIYENDFNIQYVSSNDMLTLKDNQFNDNCKIDYYDNPLESDELNGFSKLYITSSTFKKGLNINGSKDKGKTRFQIQDISIVFSALTGIISINGFSINEIKISGYNTSASLSLKNILFKKIDVNDFSNYSNIKFIDCHPSDNDSEMSIIDSYLGKTQFFNVDLRFERVNIINSYFTEIITTNVKWFLDDKLVWKEISDGDVLVLKKELYRQLKVAMEKHGSQSDFLFFKRLEMHSYQEELNLTKGFWNSDSFIMLTNKSNDHGQNWWLPICLAVISTIPFYCLITISVSPNLTFFPSCKLEHWCLTINELMNNFKLFPQLFNPARYLDRIINPPENLTWITYTLDLFHRILISYFIFQTVSAFRKFNKN